MLPQLVQLIDASRDGQDASADGLGAVDVERGIAYDEDFVAGQFAIDELICPIARDSGDLTAVFAVIAEAAGLEVIP